MSVERWKSLLGKRFLVTGAGTGYGRVVALALGGAGATLILSSRRGDKLQRTLEEALELGAGPDSVVVTMDLKDAGSVDAAVKALSAKFDFLHGLVSCAALPQRCPNPLTEGPAELWDDILNTNVRGQWLLAKSVLPLMLKVNHVRIIFMSSMAGWSPAAGFGMYNISKAALNSLGHSLAAEVASRNPGSDTQINVVAPGEALTEMNQGSTVDPAVIVPVTLALLSHPPGGPNGRFFLMDGSHLDFCMTKPYERPLI
jgi:3-oxoacyl-[acyl-carrier protein] reductase